MWRNSSPTCVFLLTVLAALAVSPRAGATDAESGK